MADRRLSEIWIYPVKSLGGIRLPRAKVLPKGLQNDRRWMLVDENGICMTQRIYPIMSLFKVFMDGGQMTVRFHDNSITIPCNLTSGMQQIVQIWDDAVETLEADPNISKWFSEKLNMTCKLVYFPEKNSRPVDPLYKLNDEHVSLADAYPFLIIGQKTLEELNRRLEHPLPMNRFRPNFVCTGFEPHEEDTWKNFTIGSNRFAGVKPCSRCVLPTIDQDTGEKGVEPLKTLSTYRKKENNIYFGQNLLAIDHLEIKEGDLITIQSYQ